MAVPFHCALCGLDELLAVNLFGTVLNGVMAYRCQVASCGESTYIRVSLSAPGRGAAAEAGAYCRGLGRPQPPDRRGDRAHRGVLL